MTAITGYHGSGVAQVRLDASTHTMQTIEYEHHEIHSGSAYMLTRKVTLPAGNDDEIRIATPDTAKWAHWVFSVVSDAGITVDFYEATELANVGGNALTPINRNRNSTNTSGLTICHTPSGAGSDGSLIFSVTAGVAGNPAASAAGEGGARHEIILKQNTAYLFRASGTSGDVVTINFDWYEHTDKS